LLTVVDEAFLPFLRDESERTLTTEVATRNNLLVLRSLTKIHAIPGLRVGYAIASADMIERLRDFQDPWTVSSAAEAAALAALDDIGEAERRESIEKLAIESAWMLDWLWELQGIRPAWPDRDRPAGVSPLPNFHLVNVVRRGLNSFELHEALAKRGFLTRECSNFPGLEPNSDDESTDFAGVPTGGSLRIAVRTRPENEAILAALASILDERSNK
jgi:threonine-phosphate decarboxylase